MRLLKHTFSIDETKVSVLVIAFLFTLGVAFFQLWRHSDISDNMVTLLGYEIMAVTGVNVAVGLAPKRVTTDTDEKGNEGTMLP